MLRAVSDGVAYVAGLFVESASTDLEAEAEAKEEMVRSISDDGEYWERLSSGVLSEEVPTERVATLAPEFQAYAVVWAKYGRSLDVIGDFAAHTKLHGDRFQRKQDAKARRGALAARRAALASAHAASAPPQAAAASCPTAGLYEPVTAVRRVDPHEGLAILMKLDEKMAGMEGLCRDIPSITKAESDAVVASYDYMMEKFMEPRLKQRYGYNSNDHRQRVLRFGESVPSYFANVVDQSIHRRKVLSMAGLRNLVMYGPIIYAQLAARHFSGDLSVYGGSEGLQLMRQMTGNVVDLDTTVLRCSDKATVNVINMSNKHKKLPVFSSFEAFAQSDQAQEIAVHCSVPLLDDFAAMMGLRDEKALRQRCIHRDQIQKPIPIASSNTDRGRHPIWHYVNAGQDSFHANVPTMEDVNGALLKAPVQCAMHWMMLHTLYDGAALEDRIDKFFEDCIVDSCFNMKWKSIELFGIAMRHEGTVVDVLQRAQMQNQQLFTEELFDTDDEAHTAECALLWSIVKGRVGRDSVGKMRPITDDDVKQWVNDPSVVL
jgi:hypothetical protein